MLRKRLQSVCDMAKPRAPVIAPPRVEANIPMNVTLEAIAIVFDLVDPARPTRRPLGQRCQRGFDRSGNIRAFAPRDECAMASAGLFKSWYSMAPRNTGSVWKNHLSALANRGATAIHPKAGGITLLLATGSRAHVAGLREIAAKRNMSLDESGLRRGNKVIAAATEQKIYKALNMQPVAPELREAAMRSPARSQARCPNLLQMQTSKESCTHIRISPTGWIHWKRWRTQRWPGATNILASLIIRSPPITLEGSALKGCRTTNGSREAE